MRILMIFTSKFHYTGITKVVLNYYEELIKNKDIEIDFVVPNDIDQKLMENINLNKSKIFKIPMKVRRMLPINYILKLKKIIKNNNYDIVHIHGSSSIMVYELLAARFAGVKTRIAHSHNTVTEHKIIHKLLYPLFVRNYTEAFACGEEAGEWLFKNRNYYLIKNAQKIENYVFNENARKELRKKYNVEDKIVLGHVGAFCNQKNHEFLIDVFKEIVKVNSNYYLVLIGEGPLYEKIKEKVKNNNLEEYVLFVGKTLEVGKWLNMIDIMLLPSKYEGFPNVLIEWQINGLPCLLSNNITNKVAITNLVSFEELNIEKWKNKILGYNINSNDRENKEYINKIKQSGFEIKSASKNLTEIYEKIIKEKECDI